jgi:nucleoside-diphosphate-sugar epimerase
MPFLQEPCKPQSQILSGYQAHLLESNQIAKLMAKVQPTHLLHFAWYGVPGKYWTSIENLHWVQASLNLLQAFVAYGGQRVVMAGTCAEYDWKYGYCSEHITPLLPTTLYGTCKHSLQTILESFSKQTGLSSAWGRIFFVYGSYEHQDRLVAFVIRSLLQGKPAPCSEGNQIRDFLQVKDVASAFVTLLQSNVQGAVNIGSGKPVSLKELINKIGEKTGHADLIRFGEKSTSANEPPLLVANTHKLNKAINWTAHYKFDDGLEQTLQWWKDTLGIF